MDRNRAFAPDYRHGAPSTRLEDELWDADVIAEEERSHTAERLNLGWVRHPIPGASKIDAAIANRDWYVPVDVGRFEISRSPTHDHLFRSIQIHFARSKFDLDTLATAEQPRSLTADPSKSARVRFVATLWDFIRVDPVRFMRRTLYLLLLLSVMSSFSAAFGGSLASIILAAGILVSWGVSSLLIYAASGSTILNPLLGTLALVAGLGTFIVALLAFLT